MDPSSPQPLYVQLARNLRGLITSGELAVGERIPTTAELTRELGVSTTTVNQAIGELVREGLLSRRPRLGTFVTGRVPRTSMAAILSPFEERRAEEDGFVMRLFRGLKEELSGKGCAVSVVPCSSAGELSSLLPQLSGAGGVALVGPVETSFVEAVRRTGKPAVALDTPGAHNSGVDSVVVDNVGLARLAVSRLLSLGHRRILYHAMGPNDPDNDAGRLRGYRLALEEAGVKLNRSLVVEPRDGKPSERMARALEKNRATAVFLANSGYYDSALRAARMCERAVPEGLSIVCFGGAAGVPSPAHVDLDAAEMGRRAAARLLRRMDGDSSGPVEEVVGGVLLEGESVARARGVEG